MRGSNHKNNIYTSIYIWGGPSKTQIAQVLREKPWTINPSCYVLCGYTVLVEVFLKELPLGSLRGQKALAMNWTKSSNIILFTDLILAGMTLAMACFGLLNLNWNEASSSLGLSFTTLTFSGSSILVYSTDWSPGFCFLIIVSPLVNLFSANTHPSLPI